jgi:hypothetical protein
MYLPWAPTTIKQSTLLKPEHAAHARGTAWAKSAVAGTNRGVGTSVIARTRNASGRSAAGRLRSGRPIVAGPTGSKPSMPRQKECAASKPSPRPRPFQSQKLRRRVVTRQNLFSPFFCDRPGCYEPPVISLRNPARYCCHTCRQAVRNVLDRERKWRSRGTLDGRKKRTCQYQAARGRRSPRQRTASAFAPSRSPPE